MRDEFRIMVAGWAGTYHPYKTPNQCEKMIKKKYGKSELRKKNSMSIYSTVNLLSKIIPPNSTIVTGSSGLCIEVFYTHFENKRNQKTFLTTGLG